MVSILGAIYVLALLAAYVFLLKRQQKKINQQIAEHIEEMKKEHDD